MTTLQKKLEQALALISECLSEVSSSKSITKAKSVSRVESTTAEDKGKIIKIVNKIKNCTENDKIEKNILDKTSQSGRILLPFYICSKYFSTETLTTGDIEKITTELGVKVKQPNVSKTIKKELHKYLESNKTRVKGVKTPYKLNRKGLKFFDSILNEKYE